MLFRSVVDYNVSKAAVLSACNKHVTVVEAARLLWRDVFSRFGLLDHIISNRGPQFSAKVFKELHDALGIKTSMSTVYHPQTNSQTEWVN